MPEQLSRNCVMMPRTRPSDCEYSVVCQRFVPKEGLVLIVTVIQWITSYCESIVHLWQFF